MYGVAEIVQNFGRCRDKIDESKLEEQATLTILGQFDIQKSNIFK